MISPPAEQAHKSLSLGLGVCALDPLSHSSKQHRTRVTWLYHPIEAGQAKHIHILINDPPYQQKLVITKPSLLPRAIVLTGSSCTGEGKLILPPSAPGAVATSLKKGIWLPCFLCKAELPTHSKTTTQWTKVIQQEKPGGEMSVCVFMCNSWFVCSGFSLFLHSRVKQLQNTLEAK